MIAITNGKVITITQGVLECGTILVDDGRIIRLPHGGGACVRGWRVGLSTIDTPLSGKP
jgi:hypothetical protein